MVKRHHPLYLETINLLANGASSRTSEFHQFVFSSLNVDQVQSRYVVLRNFIEEDHNLIFFTDQRSPKVNAILKNSRTECLFYDNVKKIQLRIKTQSYILHDKKKISEYWEKVPLVSRQSYSTQLPPSTVLKGEKIDPSNGLSLEEDHNEKSFCNFCVIENYIKEIDFQKTIEFKTFELAIEYLFSLGKWPPNHPVLTGSIFLVAEFIKFANKQKC